LISFRRDVATVQLGMNLDLQQRMQRFGETTMIEVRPSVAVVGAGLAGLTAARLLT
jgi:heterodisulfide reductase subunit A-like polyferredoxin